MECHTYNRLVPRQISQVAYRGFGENLCHIHCPCLLSSRQRVTLYRTTCERSTARSLRRSQTLGYNEFLLQYCAKFMVQVPGRWNTMPNLHPYPLLYIFSFSWVYFSKSLTYDINSHPQRTSDIVLSSHIIKKLNHPGNKTTPPDHPSLL